MIDKESGIPYYRQLMQIIQHQVVSGGLKEGQRLPRPGAGQYVPGQQVHRAPGIERAVPPGDRRELLATGRGDLHVPVGWGEAPARAVFDRLPDYRGVVTLEIRPRYRVHYPDALANARALLD
jgi:hypothetical protein